MRNVRARIAYDGSRFFGWQRQEGFRSVQEALEEALETLVGDSVVVHGSGRTDTGVHALGQVAHFHLESSLGDDRLRHALNFHLPPGVVVLRLETCPADFHARFAAIGKRYLYLTRTSRFRSPFGDELSHWIPEALNADALRRGAAHLVGEHDFASFASAGSPRKTTVRTVQRIRLVARRDRFALVVDGNGFLYNMVRTIAGTLIEVARGRLEPDEVRTILEARDRSKAGPTAPAAGLYLARVHYAEPLFCTPDRGPRGVSGLFQP